MARSIAFDEVATLEKAKNVFWQKGYHATSMQDLLKATGLNPGSLYNTYGGKHELFLACLRAYLAPIGRYATAPDESPLALLERFLTDTILSLCTNEDACLAIRSCFELAPADQEVRQLLRQGTDNLTQIITLMLTNAQQAGEISPDKDAGLLAPLLVSAVPGLGYQFVLYRDAVQTRQLVQQLLALVKG